MSTQLALTSLPASAATGETHIQAFWSLRATSLSPVTLRDAWVAEGLSVDLLPSLPSNSQALCRAVDSLEGQFKGAEGAVVVAATKHKSPPLFHIVTIKNAPEGEVEIGSGLKVWVSDEGSLKHIGEDPCGLLGVLNARFEAAKEELDPSKDLSGWIVGLVTGLLGVAIRPAGGTYLILAPYKDTWRKMMRALQTAMPVAEVFEITTVGDENTMQAMVAAITREILVFAEKTDASISDGNNRKRGIATKKSAVLAALKKVKTFEQVLSVSLGDLSKTLGTLSVALVKAECVEVAAAV